MCLRSVIRLARCSSFLTSIACQEAGERHLIALYASALGENAVERYALFLVALGMTAIEHASEGDASMHGHERESVSTGGDDIEERKRALIRAREHGLDVDRVAVVAAERTVDRAFEARSSSLSS